MDDLEHVLRNWRSFWCSCRVVSNGVHEARCVMSSVDDGVLDSLAFVVEEWYADIVDAEVAEAAAVPVVPSDDPE